MSDVTRLDGGEAGSSSQTNPLWRSPKVKNYLPDMTWVEVHDLLERTDLAIIPFPSMEQHGPQGALGTDFYNGVAQAQLIAQRTDALVAPVLMAGNSPYHMGFAGSITLSTETLVRVYFEAALSLIHHGFKKLAVLNAHGGNAATTKFVVDRINQETSAVAIDLLEARRAVDDGDESRKSDTKLPAFDRHAGILETSASLYLSPTLVQMDKAPAPAQLTLPPHLRAMIPAIQAGDSVAELLFLAEALKAESTGKHTSTREMTKTGVWTEGDVRTASAAIGKQSVDGFVALAVKFIEKWKRLVPLMELEERTGGTVATRADSHTVKSRSR